MTTIPAGPRPREAELTPAGQGVPVDRVALPPEALACVTCGVAVRDGTGPVITLNSFGRGDLPSPHLLAAHQEFEWTFSLCPECAGLRRRAAELLAADPHYRARTGSEDIALHRVEVALGALAALGQSLPAGTSLAVLTHHLSSAGARARWSARFVPLLGPLGESGTCAPWPWACVSVGQQAALRDGYAALLAARIALTRADVALAPPPIEPSRLAGGSGAGAVPILDGCVLCGVGVVTVTAARVTELGGPESARAAVWRPITVSGPDSLGGRHGPERVEGYACPACARAIASVGSVGPGAMEASLAEHLRSIDRGDDADRLLRADDAGVVAFGALAYDAVRRGQHAPAPGRTPWEHIDLGVAALGGPW